MKVSKILESFAKSKTGQKLYKWACEPKSEDFLNNSLPTIETAFSTACYIYSTHKQKNIEPEQKELLQWQNVLSGVAGMAIGSWANRKVSKYGEEVIKHIDQTKIDPKSLRQISTGVRIMLPLVTTATLMRFITPTIIAGVSGKIMDKKREQKLNTVA